MRPALQQPQFGQFAPQLWRQRRKPRQPADQRYQNAYLFGAACPARGTGAALMMPKANTIAMRAHLDEISLHIAPGAYVALLMDTGPDGRLGTG